MNEEILDETYVEYKGFNIQVECATEYGRRLEFGWYATIYAPGTKFPTLFVHHVLWADPEPKDEDRSSYENILEFAKKEIDLPNFRLSHYTNER
jgi:hypothetical protein